jgi:lipopolysaccharide transport system permease protein
VTRPSNDRENAPNATTVYTPDSILRTPSSLVRSIVSDVWRYRELTWVLFLRDLKAQYRQSYLGYLWAFLPIIATTATWIFLNSSQIISLPASELPYPVFVLSGVIVWNAFAMSVVQPSQSFGQSKDVFMKLKVPVEAFILAGFGQVIFNLAIQFLCLIPVFLYFQSSLTIGFLFFPLGLLCSLMIGMALGLAVVPLASLYSDWTRGMQMLLGFGMLLAPVAYPLPEAGLARIAMDINPLTPVIVASRDYLSEGRSPQTFSMIVITLISVCVVFAGFVVIRIAMPRIVERMGM